MRHAPPLGFEPRTGRLTADYSAAELQGNALVLHDAVCFNTFGPTTTTIHYHYRVVNSATSHGWSEPVRVVGMTLNSTNLNLRLYAM